MLGGTLIPSLAIHNTAGRDQIIEIAGLEWYTRSLKIDEDGDVADEFLEEVPTRTPNKNANELHQKTVPKFKAKLVTNPAKARNPRLSSEGRVYVKCQGRLQLIG
ncbi:hypothetical protein Tco_1002687 [Tanacetum coccineum]|uniref:Uncharacterized protein n=1 Tax=Tanacetum coccineum TaxID=301880 RepID=A0ABQ5F7V9_9ASTR